MTLSAKQSFSGQLAGYRTKIDQAMATYFASDEAHLNLKFGRREEEAFDYLKDFSTRPGKRVRGALTIFSYNNFAPRPKPGVLKAAIAVELIQNYLLIVDDVMDRSARRRGKPTVHELVKKRSKGSDAEHFSNMLAVNVGLLASHMAGALLASVDEAPANVVQALKFFDRNIAATVYGQIDDLYNHQEKQAGEASIIRLHELKNSYYTFINPLQLGAALAGVKDQKVFDEIVAIGLPAGVAFQLHDDILGVFGDEDATGKSASDDIREGKFTLLMLYTLERASKADAAKVRAALGNPNISSDDCQRIRDIVEASGAHAAAEAKARAYKVKTQKKLANSSSFVGEARQFLNDLIEFSVSRKA